MGGSIPEYSIEALQVRDIFDRGLVDYKVYVEDSDQENLYMVVLAKAIPKLSKFQVYPLGGKENVLAHASQQSEFDRTSIYILDKDFDDLLGQKREYPGLYYLDAFCIESVIVDEVALLEVSVDEQPKLKRDKIAELLAFQKSLDEWLPIADRLHRAFFLCQKHQLGIENCGQSVEVFTQKKNPSIFSSNNVEEYLAQVAELLVQKGVIADITEYAELSRKAFGDARLRVNHISGKYLAGLWYHRLRAVKLASNMKKFSFLIRLARYSRLLGLKSLRKSIQDSHL